MTIAKTPTPQMVMKSFILFFSDLKVICFDLQDPRMTNTRIHPVYHVNSFFERFMIWTNNWSFINWIICQIKLIHSNNIEKIIIRIGRLVQQPNIFVLWPRILIVLCQLQQGQRKISIKGKEKRKKCVKNLVYRKQI